MDLRSFAGVLCILLLVSYSVLASDFSDLECIVTSNCSAIEGAECDGTVCYCPGYAILNSKMTKCLPVATGPGDTCEEDAQCSTAMYTGSACISGECACQTGMHYLLGKCWNTKVLGEACSQHEECRGLHVPEATICSNDNICECAAPEYYQREYSDCRPNVTVIGGQCSLDADCHVIGSYCKNMTGNGTTLDFRCVCSKGTSYPGSSQCNETSAKHNEKVFGASCTQDSDCTTNYARCTPSGYCACQPSFYVNILDSFKNYTCLQELGSECFLDDNLTHIANSVCHNGICSCLIGYGASADRKQCLQQHYTYNRRCSETAECLLFGGKAICGTQGGCVCDKGTRLVEEEHVCWKNVGPGLPCEQPLDCTSCTTQCSSELVMCNTNTSICECFPGYHPNTNNVACNKDAPNLGDLCSENNDCSVSNSECKSSYCKCKTGYYEDRNVCIVGVGGACANPSDCAHIENANCSSSRKCSCISDFVASIDITTCLPKAQEYGDPCLEVQQCPTEMGLYKACNDGFCECSKDYHLVNTTCMPSSGLGESCDDLDDCYLPGGTEGLVCRNYECSCDYGYHADATSSQCISGGISLHVPTLLIFTFSFILRIVSS